MTTETSASAPALREAVPPGRPKRQRLQVAPVPLPPTDQLPAFLTREEASALVLRDLGIRIAPRVLMHRPIGFKMITRRAMYRPADVLAYFRKECDEAPTMRRPRHGARCEIIPAPTGSQDVPVIQAGRRGRPRTRSAA